MKTLAAILAIGLTSCAGYTPSENAKRVALDTAVFYLNHELNSK
jgi:hypothetical protein